MRGSTWMSGSGGFVVLMIRPLTRRGVRVDGLAGGLVGGVFFGHRLDVDQARPRLHDPGEERESLRSGCPSNSDGR